MGYKKTQKRRMFFLDVVFVAVMQDTSGVDIVNGGHVRMGEKTKETTETKESAL